MHIAILGFGTIGGGLEVLLRDQPDIRVKRIFSRHVPPAFVNLDSDMESILEDTEIDTVAEALGGLELARSYLCAAMKAGKNVVTANKAVVAAHYSELAALAKEYGVSFRFSAAVGGGIPWLHNLERFKRADSIDRIGGILNGTCNLILSRMIREGADFETALQVAQDEGYAERDPSADIDGLDARRKLLISANTIFDAVLPEEEIPAFGIRHVTPLAIRAAETWGCTLRLYNWAFREVDGRIRMLTAPRFVPLDQPEATVWENGNLVSCHGKMGGAYSLGGFGSGRYPTALSMVQDLMDVRGENKVYYQKEFIPAHVDNRGWKLRWFIQDREGSHITDWVDTAEITEKLQSRLRAGEKIFAAVAEEMQGPF